MSDNEKNKDIELDEINDDELDEVTGGSNSLNPPRVKVNDYDSNVKSKI